MKRLTLTLALMLVFLASCAAPALPAAVEPVDTGVDPSAWARVPSGPFYYGLHSEQAVIEKSQDQ